VGISAASVPLRDVRPKISVAIGRDTFPGEKLTGNFSDQLREGGFHGVGYEKQLAALRFEHTFGDAVVEEDEELVVEAVDVEKEDRLRVEFKGVPGKDLKELFEGAEAAGKRDERVGFFSDERLAGVHGAGDVEFADAVMRDLEIDEDLGDDTDNLAFCCQGCFGNGLHETDIGPAVDDADVASGEAAA
jgi:hypothetical protein